MGETNLKMGIHNRFYIEVIDKNTGKVKQKAVAYNVVCNGYYDAILSGTKAENILIGGGTGTPSASDTTLFSYIGYGSTTDGSDTVNNSDEYRGIWRRTLKRTIQYNQYVNQTITEVGLATGTSGTICTHAMLQDMNGNPISILHTSTDIINIYCNIYLHYSGQNGDIHLYSVRNTWNNGDSYYYVKYYGFVHRALLHTVYASSLSGYNYQSNWNCLLIPATGLSVFYYQGREPQYVTDAYVLSLSANTQNKTLTLTASRVPTGKLNVNGLSFLHINHCNTGNASYPNGNYDVLVEVGGTCIPPANIVNESVGIGNGSTTKFKTKFIRPYDATVYINGIPQQSGVSVKKTRNEAISNTSYSIKNYSQSGNMIDCYLYMKPVYANNLKLPLPDSRKNNNDMVFGYGAVIELLDNEIGLYRIEAANGTVKGSNDGETWYDVETSTANTQMNQAGAHYKYYKFNGSSNAQAYMNAYDGYNIVFDNPPANGDVITIDYKTDSIPKDADHVLDVSITFTFGEWTGE